MTSASAGGAQRSVTLLSFGVAVTSGAAGAVES